VRFELILMPELGTAELCTAPELKRTPSNSQIPDFPHNLVRKTSSTSSGPDGVGGTVAGGRRDDRLSCGAAPLNLLTPSVEGGFHRQVSSSMAPSVDPSVAVTCQGSGPGVPTLAGGAATGSTSKPVGTVPAIGVVHTATSLGAGSLPGPASLVTAGFNSGAPSSLSPAGIAGDGASVETTQTQSRGRFRFRLAPECPNVSGGVSEVRRETTTQPEEVRGSPCGDSVVQKFGRFTVSTGALADEDADGDFSSCPDSVIGPEDSASFCTERLSGVNLMEVHDFFEAQQQEIQALLQKMRTQLVHLCQGATPEVLAPLRERAGRVSVSDGARNAEHEMMHCWEQLGSPIEKATRRNRQLEAENQKLKREIQGQHRELKMLDTLLERRQDVPLGRSSPVGIPQSKSVHSPGVQTDEMLGPMEFDILAHPSPKGSDVRPGSPDLDSSSCPSLPSNSAATGSWCAFTGPWPGPLASPGQLG